MGEELQYERERPQNTMDPYAVIVKKDGIIVCKSTQLILNVVNNPCKKFMCLIFAVWLNRGTFLPSKRLQTTV